MPVISISIPAEDFMDMKNKSISPSRVAQMGFAMIREHGGIDAVDNLLRESKAIKRENNEYLTIIEEWKTKYKNAKEELDHAREELLKHYKTEEKKPEQPKEQADVGANLIEEIKSEEQK